MTIDEVSDEGDEVIQTEGVRVGRQPRHTFRAPRSTELLMGADSPSAILQRGRWLRGIRSTRANAPTACCRAAGGTSKRNDRYAGGGCRASRA